MAEQSQYTTRNAYSSVTNGPAEPAFTASTISNKALTSSPRVSNEENNEKVEKKSNTASCLMVTARIAFFLFIIFSPFPGFYVTGEVVGSPPNYGYWGQRMDVFHWLVLVVLFLMSIGNYFKYFAILSGSPRELPIISATECSGNIAAVLVTPLDNEDYSLFLRSLFGKTLTAFCTITSTEHKVKGLYIDAILNEEIDPDIRERRKALWRTWNCFLLETILVSSKMEPEELQFSLDTFTVPLQYIQRLANFLTIWLDALEQREAHYDYSTNVHIQTERQKWVLCCFFCALPYVFCALLFFVLSFSSFFLLVSRFSL
jgi:hypothetical protein